MGILTSGPAVKNHRRIECNTANYVPFVVPGLSTGSSSWASPTSLTSLPQEAVTPSQHPASTGSESVSDGSWGNSSRGPAETENPIKNEDHRDRTGKPVVWSARMARRVQGESCGWQCPWTPRRIQFFSWIIFRAASKSGIGQVQYLYSLPEGPKLRHLPENQNYKSSLQKTHWYSRAKSGKFRWFNNCGSQSSPVKDVNLDTLICTLWWYKTWQHSGYNLSRVKNKNFSGNTKELANVPGADKEA